MTQPLKQLNPNDRKAAEEEARRIRKTADKTSTGGQLGGTFFTLLFMHWTVCLQAGHVAILDELATVARSETIAALATCGACNSAIRHT